MNSVNSQIADKDAERGRLFLASCIALTATGMTFAIRGDIMAALGKQFTLNDYQLGLIGGAAFYGFMLSILFGGALVDALGMKRILGLAFLTHVGGLLTTIFASGFAVLFAGTLLVGIGNGLVEAACNPLIATAFADRKTQKLNAFHAWFPGGLIIGGLASYFLGQAGMGWQVKMGVILLPVIVYGLMFLGRTFPQTERVQAAISTNEMYREAARPAFLLLAFCMLLTAATELGPNQWIPKVLTDTAGASGILLLVFINAVMFAGRSIAGPIVHRLSPVGLLAGSSVLSAVGLFLLSRAASPATAYLAATLFALGICYYWPTMLGLTSERFPRGGSLLLGIMGAVGNLSVALVLPYMGAINDAYKNTATPGEAFAKVAVLPVVLAVIFAAIYFSDRAKGGYKPETLNAPLGDQEPVATPL